MNAASRRDVVIIGGGVGGLVAATYLARAGLSVAVLDAAPKPGGLCATAPLGEGFAVPAGPPALHALDPQSVRDLKLAESGLSFVCCDMPLVGLRTDGRHIVLGRDRRVTARALAVHARADAEAWPRQRREIDRLARTLRQQWWGEEDPVPPSSEAPEQLDRMGVAAWLDGHFESEALKAVLAFEALDGGLSPLEPGSALALLWRTAQEMGGLQGAVAIPKGGPAALAKILVDVAKAAGADIRSNTRVAAMRMQGGELAGVELANGEVIAATRVLSCLSRRRTLCELLPMAEAGFAQASACERTRPAVGTAQVLLALNGLPQFDGMPSESRFILAERVDALAGAHACARAGRLPHDLPIGFSLPTVSDPLLAPPGQHVLSAMIRPVPYAPREGWEALKPVLLERVLSALSVHALELRGLVTKAVVLTPDDFAGQYGHEESGSSAAQMLAGWRARISTPLNGLMLCGASAEPVPAISGCAGRIAADMIVKELSA